MNKTILFCLISAMFSNAYGQSLTVEERLALLEKQLQENTAELKSTKAELTRYKQADKTNRNPVSSADEKIQPTTNSASSTVAVASSNSNQTGNSATTKVNNDLTLKEISDFVKNDIGFRTMAISVLVGERLIMDRQKNMLLDLLAVSAMNIHHGSIFNSSRKCTTRMVKLHMLLLCWMVMWVSNTTMQSLIRIQRVTYNFLISISRRRDFLNLPLKLIFG